MPLHAINMGSGGIAPLTVNICSRWRWLAMCMPQLLYPIIIIIIIIIIINFVFQRSTRVDTELVNR